MITKLVSWSLFLAITVLVAGYGYVLYLERENNNIRNELTLATTSVEECNAIRHTELANFQTALHTYDELIDIEENTNEEVTEKFKSRKFTMLSAKVKGRNTTECGCRFDGIGWVFY